MTESIPTLAKCSRPMGQTAWGICRSPSPPPPTKGPGCVGGVCGEQSPGVLVRGGRGEKKKKAPYSPSPLSPGPRNVVTPGNAAASGSLRTGARAEGPGVAGQTPGRPGARWDAGAQSSRDTCGAGGGRRMPSPGPRRSPAGAQPGCRALAASCALP